jgi:hypothetical protein
MYAVVDVDAIIEMYRIYVDKYEYLKNVWIDQHIPR